MASLQGPIFYCLCEKAFSLFPLQVGWMVVSTVSMGGTVLVVVVV